MIPFGVRQFRRLLPGCLAINVVAFALMTMGNVLAGNFLGEAALAGVSLTSPFLTLGAFLLSLVGSGTGINYSIRRGALDRDGANSVFMQGVWTTLAFGAGSALVIWLVRDAYIGFMATDPEIVRHAVACWRWLPFTVFFMCFSGLFLNCCYCDGDTRHATVVFSAQCLLSLAVIYLALRAGYGAASCSLGLAVGYGFSTLMLALHFLRSSNTFSFRWRFALAETWTIVRTSAGDALGFLGDAVVYTVLGCLLSRAFGSAALLGLPVYIVMNEILAYTNGFASSMQPIVAVYFGEGDHRSTRRSARHVLKSQAVVSLAVTVVLELFPGLIISLVGIDDPASVRSAAWVVRIAAATVLPVTLMNLLNNYYQLVGRERLAVGVTLFYWVALPLATMLVFPAFGVGCFWWWCVAARFGGVVAFAAFVVRHYGRGMFPLMLDRAREARIEVFDLDLAETEIALTAAKVAERMLAEGISRERAMRARLLTEETLMVVKDRNGSETVHAEVKLDFNEGVKLVLRDDGIIFDITDADQRVNGLRTFLVATMMAHQSEKSNILTTGFNRNVFSL